MSENLSEKLESKSIAVKQVEELEPQTKYQT